MNVCYRGKYMHFVNDTSLRMTHFKSNMFQKILLWNRTRDSFLFLGSYSFSQLLHSWSWNQIELCAFTKKKKKKKDKTFFVDKEGAEIYCFKYFLSRKDVAWLWYGAGFTGLQLLLCVMRLFSIAVQCSTESLALLVCVWASGPTATWATGRRNGWLNDVP